MLDHTFHLHTGTSMPFSGAADPAVLFKEHLADAGVKMEVVRVVGTAAPASDRFPDDSGESERR